MVEQWYRTEYSSERYRWSCARRLYDGGAGLRAVRRRQGAASVQQYRAVLIHGEVGEKQNTDITAPRSDMSERGA